MSWLGTEGAIEAAKSGNNVIMTLRIYFYFDYCLGVESEEPKAFPYKRFLPLQKVYTFDPTPNDLIPEQGKFILGGQANVSSEYMSTRSQVEYMVYPRALAMSECLWSKSANKNYSFFEQKVHTQYERMTLMVSISQKVLIVNRL